MNDEGLTFLNKIYVGNREVILYLNADGIIEGWYGKGKKIEYEHGGHQWSGGVERILTPYAGRTNEETAVKFIHEVLKPKPRKPKEILPTIIFPE